MQGVAKRACQKELDSCALRWALRVLCGADSLKHIIRAAMKAMVMLPTYNEKVNIERMVGEILKHDGVSIVVVDDSSPDGTGEIADRLAAENKGRIHVIHRKERGRGTAGIAGLKYAREQEVDCIFEMDADFSHDPRDIPRFLERIGDFDVVIGSRLVKGSKSVRSPVRRIIGNGANIYASLFMGWHIRDWCGGYKCYRRAALKSAGLRQVPFQGLLHRHGDAVSPGQERLHFRGDSHRVHGPAAGQIEVRLP